MAVTAEQVLFKTRSPWQSVWWLHHSQNTNTCCYRTHTCITHYHQASNPNG